MSTKKKLLEAAAGNAGEAVYVDDVFSTYLYTGNGGSQTITNGVDLAGEGGLTWIKSRTNAGFHFLFDTERGAEKALSSELTNAEISRSGSLTAFNNNGFSVGSFAASNGSGQNYTSWTFRKQPGFFDIVTYTGNGTAGREITHNLGSTPACMIIKRYNLAQSWQVYHQNSDGVLELDNSNAKNVSQMPYAFGNDVVHISPTATGFTIGTDLNTSGSTYIAYLFAHDAQDFGENSDEAIIKCGSYTGNGSTEVDITLGWEPQWVMIKNATDTGSDSIKCAWNVIDVMRGWSADGIANYVSANDSDAESQLATITPKATGFSVSSPNTGDSGDTYIYIAIRRPNKPASEFAATDLFGMTAQAPAVSGSTGGWNAGFVADMALKFEEALANHDINSRLTGTEVMYTDTANAGGPYAVNKWDYQEGFGDSSATYSPHKKALFRRSPEFFDVVAYTGDGTNGRTVAHNLGVTPEIIIVKSRSAVDNWFVYHSATGATKATYLNTTSATATSAGFWNDTAPTSSVFSTYSAFTNASSATYIAYLFATVAGISKVGSYTGTGNDLNVDCGFSAGARFVLVRRTDSTGDWYVWNYLFGIVAGNDPYSLLNTTAAPVTNTDYIDPLSSGFTITSSAPAALNASGGSYIFYAIA